MRRFVKEKKKSTTQGFEPNLGLFHLFWNSILGYFNLCVCLLLKEFPPFGPILESPPAAGTTRSRDSSTSTAYMAGSLCDSNDP
jgi:hypothetical protein